MKKVAVIGSGTMGNGIAHVFAQKGFSVFLADVKEELIEKAIKTISANFDRQIKKGIIDESVKTEALNKITPVVGVKNLAPGIDLVIEAVNENFDVKKSVFEDIASLITENTILASNTSSISITKLASSVKNPGRFIGMHFMNPVPVMQLVEIIRGYSTDDNTFNTIKELTERLGKIPVEVHDYPGFISNRVLMPMINEAVFAVYEGVATVESVDAVMKLGMNHPMGPLTLADFIGLDVCLAIMNVLYEGFNDPKYRACPLLKKMVDAKKLGRKSGEGFYKYS